MISPCGPASKQGLGFVADKKRACGGTHPAPAQAFENAKKWSGRLDLNQRPHRPERCALPSAPRPDILAFRHACDIIAVASSVSQQHFGECARRYFASAGKIETCAWKFVPKFTGEFVHEDVRGSSML
jgi:hypothetical protein